MTSLIRHLLSHLIFALIGLSLIGCPSSARATLAEDPRCAKLFSTLPPATLITPDSPEDDERAYALPTGEIRVFVKVIALNPRSSIETHLTLESADGSKGFLWDEKKRLFYVDARTGEYVLHATDPTGKEVSPARRIHAAADLPVIYVVVAPDASAYYRNGPLLVPLNLEPNYIAAFFPSQLPAIQAKDVSDMAKDMHLGIRLADRPDLESVLFDGRVWLFELSDIARRDEVIGHIRDWVKVPVRIAVPLGLSRGSFHALDSTFIVQFKQSLSTEAMSNWLKTVDAWRVRPLEGDSSFWILRFRSNDYCNALFSVESALGTVLESGEPDLIMQLVDHARLPGNWPNDLNYSTAQLPFPKNHYLQQVRAAWNLVFRSFPEWFPPRASVPFPDVFLASADSGIDPNRVEVACAAGQKILAGCYDFQAGVRCDDPSYVLPDGSTDRSYHGLAVYGVMSACTDNGKGIAAVAPGIRHIAVRRPPVTDWDRYMSMLLWLAGLPTDCSISAGVPAAVSSETPCNSLPPIDHPADVVNAAHSVPQGVVGIPASLDKVMTRVSNVGNGGKGTLLVYSAGNFSWEIGPLVPLAAHPHTLAVGNCWFNPGSGVEERYPGDPNSDGSITGFPYGSGGSGWGSKLDICAIGDCAQTIQPYCGVEPRCIGWSCGFRGTSAASATASAVAGILLAVSPKLTPGKVRAILRGSADKIQLDETHPDGVWVGGRSKWYGSGRLNACRAVLMALPFAGISPSADDPCLRP